MRTKRETIHKTGKIKKECWCTGWYATLFAVLLLVLACTQNDDLEVTTDENTVINEPPGGNTSTGCNTPEGNHSYEITYIDLEPDFSGDKEHNSYALDLNKDQIIDFYLSWNRDSEWEFLTIKAYPETDNGILSVSPWYTHPVPLDEGTQIVYKDYRNGAIFSSWAIFTFGDCFGGEASCMYDWKGKVDKYVGLRFWAGGKLYYGWLGMQIEGDDLWVIKDYAYNAIAFEPISAGQKE